MKTSKSYIVKNYTLALFVCLFLMGCENEELPLDTGELVSQISRANTFLEGKEEGNEIGQYPVGSVHNFKVKIDWAELILEREKNQSAYNNAVRILEVGMKTILESEIRPGYPSISVGSSILAPASPDFAPLDELSVECRIKLNSLNSQVNLANIISTEHQYNNPNNGGFTLRYNSANHPNPGVVEFVVGVGPTAPILRGVNAGVQLTEMNKWYHIAATYNASTLTCKLYVDGDLKRQNVIPRPMLVDFENGGPVLGIGTAPFFGGRNMDGQIIDVRIWGKELTIEEINANKDDFLTNIDGLEGLNAYWPFDVALGNKILDKTGNHTVTLSAVNWVAPD